MICFLTVCSGFSTKVNAQSIEPNTQIIVSETGLKHTFSFDNTKRILIIDGEEYPMDIKIENTFDESSRLDYLEGFRILRSDQPTKDYSTKVTYNGKIPWKGSVILLSAAIGAVFGGNVGSTIASTIAGALTSDAENLYYSFVQYRSNETFWSSYYNTSYNKYIYTNQTIRQSSQSGKIIYGPVNGNWFDPIRPE